MIPFFRPEAIELFGPLSIQPFGVLLAAGFLLGSLVAQRYARRRGLDPKLYTDILFWLALSAIVSAHLGHVFYEPRQYIENPLDLLKFWSGLSSFGAYFGCTVASIWFFRSRGVLPFRGGDLMMIGLAFGIFVGRLGCFVVHDHIGHEVSEGPEWAEATIGWLAVEFPTQEEAAATGREALESGDATAKQVYRGAQRRGLNKEGAEAAVGAWVKHYPEGAIGTVRYDLGLMDSLLGLFVFLALAFLARKPRREGFLLGMTPLLYMPIRIVWDSLRNTDLGGSSTDVRYLGLATPGQIGAILLIGLGLWTVWQSSKRPHWPGPQDGPWVEPRQGTGKRS